MKKILFAAFAASLLAAGCQKTEVYRPANSGEKMTFSTEMKKITKAGEDGTTDGTGGSENQGTTTPTTPTGPYPAAVGNHNLEAQGFNIWAYADYSEAKGANNVNAKGIFDGMENWYVGHASGAWSANKEFYWPGKDKELHFFAVSGSLKNTPSAGSANLNPAKYNVTINPYFTKYTELNQEGVSESKMTIQYTIQENADDDLMVADFIIQDQADKVDNTTGKVALNFRHTLSKVQFVFKTTELTNAPEVYIQKLTVTNLKNTGTLTVKAKSGSTSTVPEGTPVKTEVDPKWDTSAANNDTSYEVESEETVTFTDNSTIDYVMELKDGKNVQAYNSNCGTRLTLNEKDSPLVTWLMMPQDLTEASKIEVFYLIKNRQFKAVFPLKQDNVNKWEENKFTKYIITLSPNVITFSGSTTEWTNNTPNVEDQN